MPSHPPSEWCAAIQALGARVRFFAGREVLESVTKAKASAVNDIVHVHLLVFNFVYCHRSVDTQFG